MSTRTELVVAIRERYQRSNRTGRTAILDEFVAVTGYHRKHASVAFHLPRLPMSSR
jgi:hypothetical protein